LLLFSTPFSKMFLFSLFCFQLVDFITLFTLVLLRPLGGVIFCVFDSYYSVLPFVHL
jgi:hypothetical protein